MRTRFLFRLCIFLVLSQNVFAGDATSDTLVLFENAAKGFQDEAVRIGGTLLFGLLGIQIAINGIKKLIAPSEMEGLVKAFVTPLLTTAFFVSLISLSSTFLPAVVNEFHGMGKSATKVSELTPGKIMIQGIALAEKMAVTYKKKIGDSWWNQMKNIFPAMFLLFIQIVIVVSFVILAMQMALAIIGGYLWYCVTPILLGFGGLSYTRDMALSALKGGIAIGMKILVIYLVAYVAGQMGDIWGNLIADVDIDNTAPLWIVASTCAIMAYLSFQIPKLASDLLNGQSSLSAGDAATNTMMGMAALATAGAGAMAAGEAMKHAGGAAAETLGGLAQAGMSGMNSAHDAGKSGLDALGHAAKEVSSHSGGIVGGSLLNMLDTSTSNMRRGMDESFGGRVAQSIESSRGGSISKADGGGSGGTGSTKSAPAEGVSGSNSSGDSVSSPGESGLGDASQASLSSGESTQNSNDKLGQQLEELASAMKGGKAPSTADNIRNLAGYVPNDQATVGVNSNLGHGGSGEE